MKRRLRSRACPVRAGAWRDPATNAIGIARGRSASSLPRRARAGRGALRTSATAAHAVCAYSDDRRRRPRESLARAFSQNLPLELECPRGEMLVLGLGQEGIEAA